MKHFVKFSVVALAAMTAGLLNSCTKNDSLAPDGTAPVINLLKAPDVIAYSGSNVWGSTLPGTRTNAGDGDLNNDKWKQFDTDALENITEEERTAVLAAIKKKVTGSKISENVVFPWENYFLQDVISGQNGEFEGAGSNGTSSASYQFEAWNTGADCRKQNQWYTDNHTDEFSNYELVTNSGHINNYFQKQNADGSQTRITEIALMTGMTYGTYEEMAGKQFRWYINCHENLHWYEYITVQVNGSWYICFDFGCGYPENDVDGNPGRGAEHNDWDYNDWIIKITPAVANGEKPEDPWTSPKQDDQDNLCPKCGHENHGDGECDECGEDEPCHKDDNNSGTPDTPQPELPKDKDNCDKCGHPTHGDTCNDCKDGEGCNETTPGGHIHDNEVEVNLSADDKGGYYDSHLSIHVRAATDVEVFIPIPQEYLVQKDDMDILISHKGEGDIAHGGYFTDDVITYTVSDGHGQEYKVTLTISYEEDGIRITTDGINQEIIDICQDKYDDGITFEIWNYINDKLPLDVIKEKYLNKATIKFLDKEPDYYINAFGEAHVGNGVPEPNDCTVSIVDEQRNDFGEKEVGEHLNGSHFNEIFENKNHQNND